jgi:hypothetical protein
MQSLKARLGFLSNPFISEARDALRAGAGYIRRHPAELLTLARNAAGLKLTVPLDALRWLAGHAPAGKGPRDVEIAAAPPALTVGATQELMGNAFRSTADIRIDEVRASTHELVVVLRVANLQLKALGAQDSPMANLFRAMDMSDPAALMNFMPQKSPAIVEAKKDRFVLDLMRVPKLAANPVLRRVVDILSPLVSILDVYTEADHLVVQLKLKPTGLSAAVAALRK